MKCLELLRLLLKDGWVVISTKGSHLKMKHSQKSGVIIFPDHGAHEIGKGMEMKIRKEAGLK